MNIEQVSEDKIKVVVSKDEQSALGITYEQLNYSDSNTRKLCEKILRQANRQIGFYIGNSRLLVEAKQSISGAITLYLSRIMSSDEEAKEFLCQTVKFKTINDLFDGCELFLPIMDKIERSRLLEYENSYYLYFEILCVYDFAKSFLEHLLEYSERTPLDPLYIGEHGKTIVDDGALEKILYAKN